MLLGLYTATVHIGPPQVLAQLAFMIVTVLPNVDNTLLGYSAVHKTAYVLEITRILMHRYTTIP